MQENLRQVVFMCGNFEAALKELMYWEGGAKFHKVAGDAGGATKYGVSLRFLRGIGADINHDGHVNESDVESLTEDQARGFYLKHFWLHYQLQAVKDPAIATKLLNIFVNMRGKTAALVAQRALGSCGSPVKEDGYIGPMTLAEINNIETMRYLIALRSHQESVYRTIVARNPSQEKFLAGWVRRARDQK